jgi:hypothetical protein
VCGREPDVVIPYIVPNPRYRCKLVYLKDYWKPGRQGPTFAERFHSMIQVLFFFLALMGPPWLRLILVPMLGLFPTWRTIEVRLGRCDHITIIILVALLLENDGENDTLDPISCSQGLWTSGRPISSSQWGTSWLPSFRAAACGSRGMPWC